MKYYLTFDFYNTKEEAEKAAAFYQKTATPYQRKHHPAHVTPWESKDRTEKKYICWTYYRR